MKTETLVTELSNLLNSRDLLYNIHQVVQTVILIHVEVLRLLSLYYNHILIKQWQSSSPPYAVIYHLSIYYGLVVQLVFVILLPQSLTTRYRLRQFLTKHFNKFFLFFSLVEIANEFFQRSIKTQFYETTQQVQFQA